jgi:Tfp pilus assembly protein PilV
MKKLIKGQSLFEVTVTLMIVSLVVTAIAGLALLSIKSGTYSRNKTLSTRYVQEANEWIRAQKDASWSEFISAASTHSEICMQDINNGWTQPKSTCGSADYIPDTNLIRQVSFPDFSQPNSIPVDVTVSWTDNNGLHESNSVTYLTNHQ